MAVNPKLAATASGLSAFVQNFLSAVFTQLFGFLANGTVWPLIFVAMLASFFSVVCGYLPWRQARKAGAG